MSNTPIKALRSIAATLTLALLAPAMPTVAQGFDLSSQRKESRHVNPVPGHKVDHHGLVINPTPQSLQIDSLHRYAFPSEMRVTDTKKKYDAEIAANVTRPMQLSIDYDAKKAVKKGVKPAAGAYLLTIGKKGAEILGYDDAGAFYGLQTLRQILDSDIAAGASLPYMTINDYPSLSRRGVIEGFYGTPWSHEVRLSLLDYYGRNKLNDYFYGPKDDPYHSVPNWRLPYPEDQAKNIKELVEAAKRNRVDFVWAIHPGADIRWNEADFDSLVNKLNMMYDLGVRSFALFFDDIDGEGRNPEKQVELFNRINREFVKEKGDVSNIVVCPTDYSRLWASPKPNGPLATYGRSLDKAVEVFYTGDVVCSDLTHDTMDFFNGLVKRPGYYWWNYPVSDYCRNMILQGPVYGLDTTITDQEVVGFASNPMEHGEASKLALYGVADYAWNIPAYNAIDNWERGLVDLMPEASEAYRTFGIHSADTETGYRRDESWETETFFIDEYTPEKAAALRAEFERIAAAPKTIETKANNKMLVGELKPWLTEFEKLGNRGIATLDLIELYRNGNDQEFWNKYVGNVMTEQQRNDYTAHRMGTMKLQPFIDNAMSDMAVAFFTRLTGQVPMILRGVGSFPNAATTVADLMFDGRLDTYYTSSESQNGKSWIGVDLGDVRDVDSVYVYQGRNSVDDVDYFDNVVLQASVDGNVWTDLTLPMTTTYEVTWSGAPVKARYVRIKRLDSKRSNWASVREFIVNPATPQRIGFTVDYPDTRAAMRAFDSNPTSAFTLEGHMAMPVKAKEYVLLTNASNMRPIVMNQRDAKGNVVAMTIVEQPYQAVAVADGATTVTLDSNGTDIFEIVTK